MTAVLKLLCLSLLLGFCRGHVQIWPINSHESVCPGETVSFELEITNPYLDNYLLAWRGNYNYRYLEDSEHYSLNENRSVLTIYDALPRHAGGYEVFAMDPTGSTQWDYEQFHLEVPDVHLHSSEKSPVKLEVGGKATLMVNRSDAGDLFWLHNGEPITGDNIHYSLTAAHSGDPNEVGLEISDATAEQDGLYEAVLVAGSCRLRNIFEVQVQEVEKSTEESGTESDSKLWGIIDYKYLKVFSGDFTGEWYVAPAVLAPIVILFLVLIICIIRQKRKGKRSKRKDKGEVGVTRQILFEEPIYTVQDQVFYPPADTTYDIAPVTSSHPQSTSLRSYGEPMPLYGMDSLLGPPVPPPSTGLRQTYSAMSELDFSDRSGSDD